jgi:DUF4097 and DUF4098 domain-containing protein YvlB
MTRTSFLIGATLVLALAASADGQQRRRTRDDRDHARTDESGRGIDTTVAFAKGGTVSLTITSGEIVVTAWNRDEVRVQASSEDSGVRFNASSARVTVELAGARRSSDTHIEISVPVGTRVSARAQSGDVSIRGNKADVEASTQSGDIVIDDVAGRVDVNTLSGEVQAEHIEGDVEIKALGGDVTLESIKGDIDIETVSGEITIKSATAKNVRAHTTSGDVTYDGDIDPQGRYELSSHSGDVRLGVQANIGAQISISTWSGTVESDFPMTLKPGEHGIGSGTAKRFNFEVGNGSARITLGSFSGDITINSSSRSRSEDDQ